MNKQILFCRCNKATLPIEEYNKIINCIDKQGIKATVLNDLCGLCATQKEQTVKLFTTSGETLLVACHARTIKSLLEYVTPNGSPINYQLANIKEDSIDEIEDKIRSFGNRTTPQTPLVELNSEENWPSWYPVIDYDRCTACGQCADFCLFGVYEKQKDTVKVVNPKSCKNNCPACGRICPQVAIIFPKFEEGGAISGTDSIDESAEQQRQQQDTENILGNDIYKALEKRKRKRQQLINPTSFKMAFDERDKALKEKDKKNLF